MEDIKLLQEMTDRVLAEAPSKKKGKKNAGKGEAQKGDVQPKAYSYSEALDFARPLGFLNPAADYVNYGPNTGGGASAEPIHDLLHTSSASGGAQRQLQSAWEHVKESVDPTGTWERLNEMSYDMEHEDIQEMGPGCDVDEAHIGFKKLSHQLSHEKGVKDPGALAAAIGRKKYGPKAFAAKSAAGHK